MRYAFCEPVTASTRSRWHIRAVGSAGLYLTGGLDDKALCGADLHNGWDLAVAVTEEYVKQTESHANPTCRQCADLWRRR